MKKKESKLNFTVRAFATVPKKQVRIVASRLRGLAKARNWQLTAMDVLEDARKEISPLHPYFKWDDSEAAELWRLHQARLLLNHFNVAITINDETKDVRAFHVITSFDDEDSSESYIPIDIILTNKPMRDQLLMKALSEAEAWKKRYQTLQELSSIFEAIEKMKKRKRA